ncbi:lymphocyte antigen 6B-like isoform X2 [Mugil cephalus]|uniref:lymphocyte antigen 6B-like isoform X2 n=1 Tax=Mugil cephalus TaxID=48193 RepID=UPI001FB7DB6C|nr:lymphocyte antigen 6B-like isoform X2 [Mugil cephalus]
MYLLTLVLGIVLLPEANTLTCYECIPLTGTCTETTTLCPTHRNQCAALVASYTDGSKVWNVNAKSCVAPEECGQYSANFGVSRTVIASKCCSTDLCNTQPAPECSDTINSIIFGKKNGKSVVCEITPPNCEFNPQNTVKIVKHSAASTMIWACFSYYGVGPIYCIIDQFAYVK